MKRSDAGIGPAVGLAGRADAPRRGTGLVLPWLEASSGRQVGRDLGLCFQPEFLREGQAIADFDESAKTVIAASDAASGARLASLYTGRLGSLVETDFATAELVKYVDDAWHALKLGFANEIGSVGRALAVDSRALMAIFRLDRTLNLSGAYLKPGMAFGGSCLPRDLRSLCHVGRRLDLAPPILDAVLPSNQCHLERVLARVARHPVTRIGVVGLSFKAGTDDLRESPMVEVIERLVGKGYDVRIFDPLLAPDAMVGANRVFALAHLPHIARLALSTIEPRYPSFIRHYRRV